MMTDEELARTLQKEEEKKISTKSYVRGLFDRMTGKIIDAKPIPRALDKIGNNNINSNLPSIIMPEPIVLTLDAKLNFMADGYMILPSIIPSVLVRDAVKFINMQIGVGITNPQLNLRHDPVTQFASTGTDDPRITNLLNETQLVEVIHSLLYGEYSYNYKSSIVKANGAQIALRYPQEGNPPVSPLLNGYHIDGLDRAQHSTFNLLVGVCLSDTLEDYSGNLGIWPGSHHSIHESIAKHRLPARPKQHEVEETASKLSDIMGMDLGEPLQVKLLAGDAIIVHQKVAHRGMPNYSPHIRNMVYFRLSHEGLNTASNEEIWRNPYAFFAGLEQLESW